MTSLQQAKQVAAQVSDVSETVALTLPEILQGIIGGLQEPTASAVNLYICISYTKFVIAAGLSTPMF